MENKWIKFYFSFQGRATRTDFNIRYALAMIVGYIVAGLADFIAAGGDIMRAAQQDYFSNFWNLVIIIPTFAVTAKRLHDLGHSGWWQAALYLTTFALFMVLFVSFGVALVVNPLVGGVGGIIGILVILFAYLGFFIVLSCKRGTVGPNKYGDDLLQVTA